MSDNVNRPLSLLVILVALMLITQTWSPPGLAWDLIVLVAGGVAILYSALQFVSAP